MIDCSLGLLDAFMKVATISLDKKQFEFYVLMKCGMVHTNFNWLFHVNYKWQRKR